MSLDSASFHSRSSHAKDEFCSVTVRKADPQQKAGIRLEQESSGRVRVCNVATNGLFGDSEIEIGDIVLSINAKRLRPGEGPEVLIDVIANADSKVTVVVKKTNIKPRVEKKAKDTQDNNRKQRDSHYEGMAQHNKDGSLRIKPKPNKRTSVKKKKAMTTTISANKASPKDTTAGLAFDVKDKKLVISDIASDSIFQGTDLAVGDIVLSINDLNFRTYADASYAQVVVKKANAALTLVVEKGDKKKGKSLFTEPKKPAKVSDDDLSSTDSTSDDDEISPLKAAADQVVISAPKAFSQQQPGIQFFVDEAVGKLVVYRIDSDSIFANTSLEEGDVILSINGQSFRRVATTDDALFACVHADESVSFLVDKKHKSVNCKQQEFNLDSSVSDLNWQ